MRTSVVEASSKKQIGRELDRVIEELFGVESKESKGGQRKRRVPTFPLCPKVPKKCSSEDEFEDIEALLGNDEVTSSIDDDEEKAPPFHGFPAPDNARQTCLSELIKRIEGEEESIEVSSSVRLLKNENECTDGGSELFSASWRRTQHA